MKINNMTCSLNPTILNELREIMQGDLAFLLEAYIEDSIIQLRQLGEAVEASQCEQVRRIAHSLKGSSRNVGADRVAHLCEQLESAARVEQTQQWSSLLAEIKTAMTQTEQNILQELS
jgi:histidine phosphotransfer protein HptB